MLPANDPAGREENHAENLHFSVQDMFCLPYADAAFDVVIVSNALHIVPQPEKSLREIKRVLKDDGVLIAPTFTHAENSFSGKGRAFLMRLAGFPLHSRWTSGGISGLPDGKRVDRAEKHRAAGLFSADLYGMCEIGGVICPSLKTPASP